MKRIMFLVVCLGVFAFMALGNSDCGGGDDSAEKQAGNQQKKEAEFTAQTQERIRANIGYPKVDDSLELRNLKRRYELLDDAQKVGYVYLLSLDGKIVAEYTVKGKVSSLNSQFTNPEQVIKADFGEGWEAPVVAQAEADGSYGANPEGVFFWTSDGVYVEWGGNYLYAENRLDVQQPQENIVLKETP